MRVAPGVEVDISEQRAQVSRTQEDLSHALSDLAIEAKALSKVAARNPIDTASISGLVEMVRQAEEAADIARFDLAAAMGEDV